MAPTNTELKKEIDGYKKLIAEQVGKIDKLELQLISANKALESTLNDELNCDEPLVMSPRFELVRAQMQAQSIPITNARAHLQTMIQTADLAIEMLTK